MCGKNESNNASESADMLLYVLTRPRLVGEVIVNTAWDIVTKLK